MENIKEIINEINIDIQKIRNYNYEDSENKWIEEMGKFIYYYLKKNYVNDMSKTFWTYNNIVIEFYERFIQYMQSMINKAEKLDTNLISIMGP